MQPCSQPRYGLIERSKPMSGELLRAMIVRVESTQAARLALRLLNYPAWQVQVNGSRVQPDAADDSGQMIVPIPAGQSRISARFARTRDRTLGAIISIVSLLVGLLLFVWGSRNRKSPAA